MIGVKMRQGLNEHLEEEKNANDIVKKLKLTAETPAATTKGGQE